VVVEVVVMNVTWLGHTFRLESEADVLAFCAYVVLVQDVWMSWWI
jgi:hypothetical protein